jgi:hypothetical protein
MKTRGFSFRCVKRFWPIFVLLIALLGPAALPPNLAVAGPGLETGAKMPCPGHAGDGAQACVAQSGCLSPLLLANFPDGPGAESCAFSLPKAQDLPLHLGPAPPDQPPKLLWIL